MEAIDETKTCNFEDGRVTKELFQKIQFMKMVIFTFTLAGTGLCVRSVRIL